MHCLMLVCLYLGYRSLQIGKNKTYSLERNNKIITFKTIFLTQRMTLLSLHNIEIWFYFWDRQFHFSYHTISIFHQNLLFIVPVAATENPRPSQIICSKWNQNVFSLNSWYSFCTLIHSGRDTVRNFIFKEVAEETSVNCFYLAVMNMSVFSLALGWFLI